MKNRSKDELNIVLTHKLLRTSNKSTNDMSLDKNINSKLQKSFLSYQLQLVNVFLHRKRIFFFILNNIWFVSSFEEQFSNAGTNAIIIHCEILLLPDIYHNYRLKEIFQSRLSSFENTQHCFILYLVLTYLISFPMMKVKFHQPACNNLLSFMIIRVFVLVTHLLKLFRLANLSTEYTSCSNTNTTKITTNFCLLMDFGNADFIGDI